MGDSTPQRVQGPFVEGPCLALARPKRMGKPQMISRCLLNAFRRRRKRPSESGFLTHRDPSEVTRSNLAPFMERGIKSIFAGTVGRAG